MAIREQVRRAISEYEGHFRRWDVGALAISGLYSLFPSDADNSIGANENFRDHDWPNAKRAGVYLFFDEELDLLYVGKASMGSSIGGRLYHYFRQNRDRSCRVRHTGWSRPPRYLITVAVPENMTFEAPALEEYLISALQPPDNTIGIHLTD